MGRNTEKQRKTLEVEIRHMNRVLDMLNFRYWYYEQATRDGSENLGAEHDS